MGVEHYIVCNQCKEYIDCHKAYDLSMVIHDERPAPGKLNKDTDDGGMMHDKFLRGGYWESRGVWFMWKHRGHQGVEMEYDTSDDWYDKEPYLKEVWKHEDDLKFRQDWADRKKNVKQGYDGGSK